MFRLFDTITAGRTYIIAEMSANHAGKLENALEIVRRAAEAGADCIKIQTYTADTMTIDCDNEYFQIKDGLWAGYTLYNLYQEAGTPWEWQERIKQECEACGVDFLSTPFDRTAVDFLENLGAEAYKIASFELVDIPLIEYAASKGKPMIISCGMGSLEEIQEAGFAPYFVDHTVGVWPQAASGMPFSSSTFQSTGDAIADLNEDMAAEQKARLTYDNILRLLDNPEVIDPIRFLREREIVHFQRFGEALRKVQDKLNEKNFYAINPEFDLNRSSGK